MRVTQNIAYNAYINDMMKRQEALYEIDRKLSTGRKVNMPSDDPVNANDILNSKTLIASLDQYERNIDWGLSYLNMAEKSLDGAQNVLMRLSELAASSASSTTGASARAAAAEEVDSLFGELVSIANTNFDGRYIFSGFLTDTAAISAAGAYQGDGNVQGIKIGSGNSATIGVNGGEVFKGTSGGVDVFQAVSALSTALRADDSAGIQAAIGSLEQSFNQVSNSIASIGGRASRLTAARDDLSALRLDVRSTLSVKEDADITELISELKINQAALEAAMASAAKVFSVSIFDYL